MYLLKMQLLFAINILYLRSLKKCRKRFFVMK